MTEREHCNTVALAAVGGVSLAERRAIVVRELAAIIERERASAWLDGRNGGLDAAKRAFDDILVRERAAARAQALEEALSLIDAALDDYEGIDPDKHDYAMGRIAKLGIQIRALKEKP